MVAAWYMDASADDQRAPHQRAPPEACSLDVLARLGVLHWKLDASMCVVLSLALGG